MTLSSILSDYQKTYQTQLIDDLNKLTSVGDYVFGKHNPSSNYKPNFSTLSKHGHQARLCNNTLIVFADELRKSMPKLKSSSTFDSLWNEIRNIAKNIKGIGPVAVYDAALRLGHALGLEPDYVYLHAGPLEGAKRYFNLKGYTTVKDYMGNSLPVSKLKPYDRIDVCNFPDFPLSGRDIEHLLCLYKGKI